MGADLIAPGNTRASFDAALAAGRDQQRPEIVCGAGVMDRRLARS
jgi:hypothetical protein